MKKRIFIGAAFVLAFILAVLWPTPQPALALWPNVKPTPQTGLTSNPVLVIGDSLTTDGGMTFFGFPGYMGVAAGRGHDWPSQMLDNTNWYFHGPYLNIASNGACISDYATAGYAIMGGSNFVRLYSNAVPYVFVQLGINCTVSDDPSFLLATQGLANLYADIRTNGGHLVALTPWWDDNLTLTVANRTYLTNMESWIITNTWLRDEYVRTRDVVTNLTTQSINSPAADAHLDGTNNLLLANYIANQIKPSQSVMFRVNRGGTDRVAARAGVFDSIETGGLGINGFRTSGRNIGIMFQTDSLTEGDFIVKNEVTGVYLPQIYLSSLSVVRVRAPALTIGNSTIPLSVGGTFAVSNAFIFNAGTTATNIYTNSIPASTLLAAGDRIEFYDYGNFQTTAASTNRFVLLWGAAGGTTLLDTGSQTFSNALSTMQGYRIKSTITRGTSATLQLCETTFNMDGAGIAGSPFSSTSRVFVASENLAVANQLLLQTTSLRNGALTNLAGIVSVYGTTQ